MSQVRPNVTPLRPRQGSRLIDGKYLQWLAEKPCLICNRTGVQIHHLLKPASKSRGMGRRAGDNEAVPLCHLHHTWVHRQGNEDNFFLHHFDDADAGRYHAAQYWQEYQK